VKAQNTYPKVSVITVVRNDAAGLAKTIASVAVLDYPAIEYIVVDGASVDDTVQIILRNQRLIHGWRSEPDSGLYDAMNKGKAMATGDFAFFLNSGDVFASPDALRRILSHPFAENTILHGNVWLEHGARRWKVPATTGSGQAHLDYLPHHQTILYPRAFYVTESYDLFFRLMGDVDFTIRAIRRFPREYRDVDLVRTTLGGFTFQVCGTWEGAQQILRERREIFRRYFSHQAKIRMLLGFAALIAKSLAVMLGGVRTATRLMEWKHRFNMFLLRRAPKLGPGRRASVDGMKR